MASLYNQLCIYVNKEKTQIVRLWRRDISATTVTGYGPDGVGFPAGAETFLLSTAFRPTLGLTQHPAQRISETPSRGKMTEG
jgi:hypothetical protein